MAKNIGVAVAQTITPFGIFGILVGKVKQYLDRLRAERVVFQIVNNFEHGRPK